MLVCITLGEAMSNSNDCDEFQSFGLMPITNSELLRGSL